MTKTPTGENSVNSDDTQCDDLTVISGISVPRQGKLNEKFGICTFQDLASLSDEKAGAVAKAITGISPNMVKGWRAKAQGELSSRQFTEEEDANTDDDAKSRATESEWKSFASFVVVVQARQMKDRPSDLRIKLHHKETDKHVVWPDEDKEWPGIGSSQFWKWIVAQIGEAEAVPEAEAEAPIEASSAESPPDQVPQAKIRVTHVHAYQPAHADTPIGLGRTGDLFRGTVRGSEPFALEASFELIETTGAELVKERGTYRAKFYARNRSTGECIHLNDTEPQPLVGNRPHHTAKLPNATLSPGNYKLQVLIQLECLPPILGYLEVPLLHVV